MLDLNEFLPQDELIKFGVEEFVLSPDIPLALYSKMSELMTMNAEISGIDDKQPSKEDMRKLNEANRLLQNLMIDIISIKNNRWKVSKFIKNLSPINFNRVVMFVFKYITTPAESKKKD